MTPPRPDIVAALRTIPAHIRAELSVLAVELAVDGPLEVHQFPGAAKRALVRKDLLVEVRRLCETSGVDLRALQLAEREIVA